jgi:DNA invertase Pin-like site-specific DNA recombinase
MKIAYCRSAFAEPSDPLAGVLAQATSLHEYAEQHRMIVDGTYMDAGASGMTLIRPALQQLLADCHAGKIGVVLTADTDRLSQDAGQLAALLHKFRVYGVHVEFASGQDGLKLLDPVLAALSEFHKSKVAGDARRPFRATDGVEHGMDVLSRVGGIPCPAPYHRKTEPD